MIDSRIIFNIKSEEIPEGTYLGVPKTVKLTLGKNNNELLVINTRLQVEGKPVSKDFIVPVSVVAGSIMINLARQFSVIENDVVDFSKIINKKYHITVKYVEKTIKGT